MTTTLSPRLAQIYSNIIIESISDCSNCKINETHIFPVAEKREDDLLIEDDFKLTRIMRYDYTGNNRERYRYLRAVDLVIEYLESINVRRNHYASFYMNSYGFLYDGLEIFYETLNKSDKDSDFRANLYETLNKKVWKWGTEVIKDTLGYGFDVHVPDCCTIHYFFKRYSYERLKKKLEKDYKRYIKLILKINARMFKRDGRVYLDNNMSMSKYSSYEIQEFWEKHTQKTFAKSVLESKNMWQTFCSVPALNTIYQRAFFDSTMIIESYPTIIRLWLKE